MSNKYQNAKIYKIIGGDMCYFGSTTQKYLSQRLAVHKYHKKLVLNGNNKLNCSSHQILDFPDCQITLVELFPCQSKDELIARERYWIENNQCINKVIPGRTRQEYREQNREHRLEYNREYRQRKKLEKQTTNTQPDEIPSSPL